MLRYTVILVCRVCARIPAEGADGGGGGLGAKGPRNRKAMQNAGKNKNK